ncbi:ATP synthase subunit I [Francisella persica]|nr:ATP synthase subunit I [Francisella persica]
MLANIRIYTKKIILLQLILALVGYFVTLVFYGHVYANSLLIGSLTMFLANFVFFFRLLINKQFSPWAEIVIFYLSELLKLSTIALLTILLAIYIKPKLFSYIFGLVLLQLTVCFYAYLVQKVR